MPYRSRLAIAAAAFLSLLAGSAIAGTAPAKPVASGGDADANARPAVSVKDSPGYVPLVDPESTAVTLGRRTNAPVVRMPFRGGTSSLDALGRAICRRLHRNDKDSLLALCVADSEFRAILWREFPQSRPATGLTWEDGWTFLYARLHAGCAHAVRDHGGHVYEFLGFEEGEVVPYKNFKLHNQLKLVVRDDEGSVQTWTWLRSVAERKGVFKIYSTED